LDQRLRFCDPRSSQRVLRLARSRSGSIDHTCQWSTPIAYSLLTYSQFGVSVVLTSLWVQLSYQPLTLWRRHAKRDLKALAIISMFMGAVLGRALVGKLGDHGSIAVGAGCVQDMLDRASADSDDSLRAATALLWLCAAAELPRVESLPRIETLSRIESQRTLVDQPSSMVAGKRSKPNFYLQGSSLSATASNLRP
jgi:hypothetical protein